ncbi:DsbA family protein [Bacillus sp. FJAT-50079]|uniref:DsbA family protein n=1 Tax=Bacillus sp. FJAT-50079 TaxID=2833577 RepID=UPI0020165B03|nr:DsbA family protein [Bacillus sp. FJAT-50079]
MSNKTIVISTLGLFVVIAAFVLFLNKEEKTEPTITTVNHPSIENQPTIGDEAAPVSVIEFGDYKCPSCKAWGEKIYPQLEKEYIKTGKITFSYMNVLFHGEESILASLASESVYKHHPEAFWPFHNALFAAQPTSQNHDEQWVTVESLLDIAQQSVPNIDIAQFKADITEGETAAEVAIDMELVKELDVQFTPTIVINGVMLEDPFDYDAIVTQIEKGLKK